MSSLIKQFSSRKRDRLAWKYFEAQADTRRRKSKCLVTVSKGQIMRASIYFILFYFIYFIYLFISQKCNIQHMQDISVQSKSECNKTQ